MTPTSRTTLLRLAAVASFCAVPTLLASLAVGNVFQATAAMNLARRQDATASQIVREVAQRRMHAPRPLDTAALYFPTESASLARAQLQEKASRLVEAAHGRLEEAQFTSTPEQETKGAVALQLSVVIGNEGLRDLLYAIETSAPLLEITDMSLHPIEPGRDAGDAANGLHLDVTVRGHFRGRAA